MGLWRKYKSDKRYFLEKNEGIIMFLFLWIFLIMLGIIYKKSKKIATLQIVFVVFVFSTSSGNADYNSYVTWFQGLSLRNVFNGNVLFNILLYMFKFTGNYNVGLFVVAIFAMVIIYKAICYYTDNIAFVISLYLIAPFVIDVIQVKNFIAMAIWFYFSKYLHWAYLGIRKRHNICIYILGVAIASGFHFSFVITSIFVIIVWLKLNRILLLVAFIGLNSFAIVRTNIMDCLIEIISKSRINILVSISSKINDYTANFNQHRMETRLNLTVAIYICIVIMLMCIYHTKKRKKNIQNKRWIEFLIMLDIGMAIIFPFMQYSPEIYRVQRNLLLINYAVVSVGIPAHSAYNGKLNVKNMLSEIFCGIIAGVYLYFECIYWNYNTVFAPVFKI